MDDSRYLYFAVGSGYGEDGDLWGVLWMTEYEEQACHAAEAMHVSECMGLALELFYNRRTGDLVPGILSAYDEQRLNHINEKDLCDTISRAITMYMEDADALIRWHQFDEWLRMPDASGRRYINDVTKE